MKQRPMNRRHFLKASAGMPIAVGMTTRAGTNRPLSGSSDADEQEMKKRIQANEQIQRLARLL